MRNRVRNGGLGSPQKKIGNNDKSSVKVCHICLNKGAVTVTNNSDKRYFEKNSDSDSDDEKNFQ